MNLKTAVERWQSFDTPAMRATQDERPSAKLETTPFVLSALRSKVYRSMSGVATAVFRMNRLLVTMLLVLSALPVRAAGVGGMFGQGSTQFSLVAGNGYAFGNSYFVLGVSATHFVLDGLGVGLSLENWSGGGPGITKYSPFVQYVFYQASTVQPYVGGFYRHTAVSGLPGIESAGGRAGINIASSPNAYISVGVVHETYIDCQSTLYRKCSETYPDLSLTFGF